MKSDYSRCASPTDSTDLKAAAGRAVFFEGGSTQLRASLNSVMTRQRRAAPPGIPARRGIRNGLYSIHIRMLDGIDGGNTGVMVLHNGLIRGGDAFFDYLGLLHQRQRQMEGPNSSITSTPRARRAAVFGGYEVASVFSALHRYGAVGNTALAGKRSIASARC